MTIVPTLRQNIVLEACASFAIMSSSNLEPSLFVATVTGLITQRVFATNVTIKKENRIMLINDKGAET